MLIKVMVSLLCAAIGYLLGSVSFGVIFTKAFAKTDIRTLGSGNTGMTNVLRSVGASAGLLTGIGDFLKGAVAIFVGKLLFSAAGMPGYIGGCLAALCVLAGHLYPIYFGFKGGKGVMTSAGILLVLNPPLLILELVVFAITFSVSRIVSLSSLVAAASLPLLNIAFCLIGGESPWISTALFAFMSALVFFSHRSNIGRIKAGTEQKFVMKKQ